MASHSEPRRRRRRRAGFAALTVGLALAAPALPAAGQTLSPLSSDLLPTRCDPLATPRAGTLPLPRHAVATCTVPLERRQVPFDSRSSPGRAFLTSLLLPGAGQWTLEQRRWVLYGLIELVGWGRYVERRSTGFGLRDDYRDLAWTQARSALSTDRVDGDFEYYERVASFVSSGAFDVDPLRPGVQPEVDPTTFNGQIWALAKGIFFPSGSVPDEGDPLYEQAINYYVERGYGDRFLWDWTGRTAARMEYQTLIRRSDDALRSSTTMIGIVIANHIASAVDAYLSSRLRANRGMALRVRFHSAPSPGRAADVGVTFSVIH